MVSVRRRLSVRDGFRVCGGAGHGAECWEPGQDRPERGWRVWDPYAGAKEKSQMLLEEKEERSWCFQHRN